LYVPIEANSISVFAMLDTGATHNFVAAHMVENVGVEDEQLP
jgi:predicted aspartyl protease